MNTPQTAKDMASIASANLHNESLSELYIKQLEASSQEKLDYTAKLEIAKDDDVFKYLLLISVTASEGFIAQTRLQAEQSFRWAKRVSVVGFFIIGCGVIAGIISAATTSLRMEAGYLAALAGILVEFIGGVFFYLYNRTLHQINLMHSRLMRTQELSAIFLASKLASDDAKSDELLAIAIKSVGDQAS